MNYVNLLSRSPLSKLVAGGSAGTAVTVLVFVLKNFAGIEMSAEVVAALTTLVSFAAGYLKPLAASELKARGF